jgi:uncharacterized protein (TIGR03000 family)
MHRTLIVPVLVGLALLAGNPRLPSQEAETKAATLTVYIPANAELLVEGVKTKQTGEVRKFQSPALPVGKRYVYKLKATWKDESGKEIVREMTVRVMGGEESTADFTKEEAKKDDKKATSEKPTTDKKPSNPDEKKPTKPAVPGDADKAKPKLDVPYVPTPQEVVDRMLDLAEIKKGDVVYDLGCGDGRIVVTAAKKYGVKAIGFDIDPKRVAEARANVKKNKVEDLVEIKEADLFTVDLSGATVLTLYLLPWVNEKLIPKLEKLKDGTRIISHEFDMKGIKHQKVETVNPTNDDGGIPGEHTIYKWVLPWVKEDGKK